MQHMMPEVWNENADPTRLRDQSDARVRLSVFVMHGSHCAILITGAEVAIMSGDVLSTGF